MKVMLTSCGLETETIKDRFLRMLDKSPADVNALFIPTAAMVIHCIPGDMEIVDG